MKRLLLLALCLGGCATAVDDPSQEIYFDLANDINVKSRCIFETPNQKVQFRAPDYVKVHRERLDAVVYCETTNGDVAHQIVEAGINDTTKWNALNAGVGFIGDVFEETSWAYPSTITIDFSAVNAAIHKTPPPPSYAETAEQNQNLVSQRVMYQTRRNLGGYNMSPNKSVSSERVNKDMVNPFDPESYGGSSKKLDSSPYNK